jgi:hypothetical protein
MGVSRISTNSNIHLKTAWLYVVVDSPLDLKEIIVNISGSENPIKVSRDNSHAPIPVAEGERVFVFKMDWPDYSNIKLNKQMFDVTLTDHNGIKYMYENNLISK